MTVVHTGLAALASCTTLLSSPDAEFDDELDTVTGAPVTHSGTRTGVSDASAANADIPAVESDEPSTFSFTPTCDSRFCSSSVLGLMVPTCCTEQDLCGADINALAPGAAETCVAMHESGFDDGECEPIAVGDTVLRGCCMRGGECGVSVSSDRNGCIDRAAFTGIPGPSCEYVCDPCEGFALAESSAELIDAGHSEPRCRFMMPSGMPELAFMNIVLATPEDACLAMGKTAGAEACGSGDGWYVTITDVGVEVTLCPETCQRLDVAETKLFIAITPSCQTVVR